MRIFLNKFSFFTDVSDVERAMTTSPQPNVNPELESRPHPLNYPPLGVGGPPPDPSLSSTDTLLRNIQGLLKVAADNARQQERQVNFEKGA